MAANLEAKSLSSLNFLAANPPQYPVNPTEQPRESLVLYISRVPGTRDIILSTFKPQVKNVTAADVTNSLYYVHLDLPSDELLVPPAPTRDERSSSDSAPSAIPRKPLPPTAKVSKLASDTSETGGPKPPLERPPSPAYNSTGEQRSPEPPRHGSQLSPRPPTQYPSPLPSPVTRKPLGPRPLPTGASPVPNKDRPSTPNSQPFKTDYDLTRPPELGTFPSLDNATRMPPHSHHPPASRSPSPSKSRGRGPSFVPFSLTLIRRDPVSGNQWNVGKVSSLQTAAAAAAASALPPTETADPVDGQPKIDVRLDNSGYAKFRGMPTQASIDALRSTSAISLPPPPPRPDDPPKTDRMVEHGFARQVVMSYSKSWTTNLKHTFHRRDRPRSSVPGPDAHHPPDDLPLPPPPGAHHHHSRHGSAASATSVESWASGAGVGTAADDDAGGGASPPQPLVTRPGPGLKAKGYVFASPWDGRCEFRTGNAGRSLKCRHVLLHPGGANGGGSGLGGGGGGVGSGGMGHEGGSGARPVSELRFNLPSGDLFSSAGDGSHSRHLHDQFDGLLKQLGHRHRDGVDEDEGDPLDLTLGREKAGGGNRGKRAKLGKLIIHDEGLKMMDLVVAANVGVWWVAWEKAF